jgi:hypothetical protein
MLKRLVEGRYPGIQDGFHGSDLSRDDLMDVVRFESCPQGGFGPLRSRFSGVLRCRLLNEYLSYIMAYTAAVNAGIYMNFREAVDALCASVTHEDVAKALGASVQAVRQARLNEESKGFRGPPKNWKAAIIRLAESRVLYYRRLIEKLKTTE